MRPDGLEVERQCSPRWDSSHAGFKKTDAPAVRAGASGIGLGWVVSTATSLDFLLLTVSGWVNRRHLAVIEYLREENRVLREHLGDRRLAFTDTQRRRLALEGR